MTPAPLCRAWAVSSALRRYTRPCSDVRAYRPMRGHGPQTLRGSLETVGRLVKPQLVDSRESIK